MGDGGSNTKSPVDANSGQKGMDSHPVDFDKGSEENKDAQLRKQKT